MANLVRKHGVTEQALCRWKKKYGGLQASEAKRLKELEEWNRELRQLVADQELNTQVVKDLLGEEVVTPEQRRTAVTRAFEAAGISERQACRFTGFSRSTQRYTARRAGDSA